MTTFRAWVLIFLVFVPAAYPSHLFADQGTAGQPAPADMGQLRKGTVHTSVIFGTTLPIGLFRAHKDRHLMLGAFQIGRVMTAQRGQGPLAGNFVLLLEIAPLVLLLQPSGNAIGLTASPLHMRWNFAPMKSRPMRVFAEASGGIIYTSHAVPLRTTAFNFIDQAGFGVRYARDPKRAWLVGYRFQHVSNGGRVKPNPGANFNFVYAGVSFPR